MEMLVLQWAECMVIGRDLVRLLQLVARIPEFEKLWRDIFLNPSVLSPSFTGEPGDGEKIGIFFYLMLLLRERKIFVKHLIRNSLLPFSDCH